MPAGFDPTDPAAYAGGVLNSIDESIRGAEDRGMRILLSPSAPIPDWASASGASPVSDPDPAAFEQLMIGLGRRYDGSFGCGLPICLPTPLEPLPTGPVLEPIPRVEFWSIWNEPNLDLFLRPQFRRGKPVVGSLYRSLFLAARSGLQASGHGGDTGPDRRDLAQLWAHLDGAARLHAAGALPRRSLPAPALLPAADGRRLGPPSLRPARDAVAHLLGAGPRRSFAQAG